MKLRFIFPLVCVSFFLASCGSSTPTPSGSTGPVSGEITGSGAKIPFYITLRSMKDFPKSYVVEKSGRMVGSSQLSIASQGIGRVDRIAYREGARVKKDQLIVHLKDTIGNYGIRLEQAKNMLDSQKINYDSTALALDKSVSDAETAYQTILTNEKNLVFASGTISSSSTKASLDLANLDDQITKAELDYANLISSQDQALAQFRETATAQDSTLRTYIEKVIEESDKILGLTDLYRTNNDSFEVFLGAKDQSTKSEAESRFYALSRGYEAYKSSTKAVLDRAEDMKQLYAQANSLLQSIIVVFQNTIASSSFSQTEIATKQAVFTGLQSSYQINNGAFVAFYSSYKTFSATYLDTRASQKKGLELLKNQRGVYLKSVEIQTSQIGLTSSNAKLTLETAKKNRDITLRRLKNTIRDAQIGVESAARDYEKLSVKSPIDGVITKMTVSLGQDINVGTPLFEVSNSSAEVSVNIPSDIVGALSIGKIIPVVQGLDTLSGTVIGISSVADQNLLHAVRISLPRTPKNLGDFVTIQIPVEAAHPFLPVNIVKIVSDKQGEIQAFSGSKITTIDVDLGRVNGDNIEILTPLLGDLKIITTDVGSFDERQFVAIPRGDDR
jgi:multidrug resistance efflux pump